jgi:hypothetical protein
MKNFRSVARNYGPGGLRIFWFGIDGHSRPSPLMGFLIKTSESTVDCSDGTSGNWAFPSFLRPELHDAYRASGCLFIAPSNMFIKNGKLGIDSSQEVRYLFTKH